MWFILYGTSLMLSAITFMFIDDLGLWGLNAYVIFASLMFIGGSIAFYYDLQRFLSDPYIYGKA